MGLIGVSVARPNNARRWFDAQSPHTTSTVSFCETASCLFRPALPSLGPFASGLAGAVADLALASVPEDVVAAVLADGPTPEDHGPGVDALLVPRQAAGVGEPFGPAAGDVALMLGGRPSWAGTIASEKPS